MVTQPGEVQAQSIDEHWNSLAVLWKRKTSIIAIFSVIAIGLHVALRWGFQTSSGASQIPLIAALALGGPPLLSDLLHKLLKRELGSRT